MNASSFLVRMAAWLRAATQRRRFESEMDEELAFHLEEHTRSLLARGLTLAEARRQARLTFGGAESSKDGIRSAMGLRPLDDLLSDLRYAVRVLRNSPGFTLVATASLALAIGANTTIFSVAHFLLIERLGVPHASELRMLYREDGKRSVYHSNWGTWMPGEHDLKLRDTFSYPVYVQMKREARGAGLDLFAFKDIGTVNAATGTRAEAVRAELVSGNFYEQMQTVPALGRGIQPHDDGAPGTGAVVVLSYGYWQRAFGGAPDVLGKTLRIDTIPFTIIGVNAPGFTGAESVQRAAELTVPMSMIEQLRSLFSTDGPGLLRAPDSCWIQIMLRQPGAPDHDALERRLATLYHTAVLATVTPKAGEAVPRLLVQDGSRGTAQWSRQMRKPMQVLLGMVGCILLLACANVATLMLSRANTRQREMSVRIALGAGRVRVFRQLLVEALALAAIGGAAGTAMGYLGTRAAPSLLYNGWGSDPAPVPFHWPVLAFTAGVTLLTGVLFGLAPAWQSSRFNMKSALKHASQAASRQRKAWTGKGLVSFQIALATLLVAGSALFVRTMRNLAEVDPGFDTQGLILFSVQPPDRQYAGAKSLTLHKELLRRIGALPGVDGVSAVSVPLVANSVWTTGLHFEGEAKPNPDGSGVPDRDLDVDDVSPGFFALMRIPIQLGREFTTADTATSPRAAVVNQSFVQTYLAGRNPLGVRFTNSSGARTSTGAAPADWITIVGVAADTQYSDLRSARRPMYVTDKLQERDFENRAEGATYVVRSRLPMSAMAAELSHAVGEVDPGLPLVDLRTQAQQIDEISSQERLFATLTAGFGLLALALACVGIYGLMAYTVSQRTHEIGIRLALGADRGRVRAMVLREATWLSTLGIAVGMAAALMLAHLVRSLLYQLNPRDPLSLGLAASLLLAVSLLAGWLPAARAARLEPTLALRQE